MDPLSRYYMNMYSRRKRWSRWSTRSSGTSRYVNLPNSVVLINILAPYIRDGVKLIPYSGYFSWGKIFVSSEFLGSLWKNVRGCSIRNHPPSTIQYCFVGKNFVVHLSTTKTTKIVPPEKYPLYGS